LLFAVAWAALVRVEEGEGVRPVFVLAAALAALVLARADGFAMALVFGFYAGVVAWRRGRIGTFALPAGAVALTLAAHVAWRLSMYGYPLPNSVYAKVSGALADRLAFAWKIFPELYPALPALFLLAVLAPGAWAAAARARTNDPALFRFVPPFEVGFPIAWLAYWFFVGGDVFRERFLLVLIPLAAALLARRGRELVSGSFRRVDAVALLFVLLLLVPFHATDLVWPRTTQDRFIELGRFLGAERPGALLAADAAGKVPYYSELETIDMYGLADETIAHVKAKFGVPGHSKSDPAYVLARRPDLVAGWLDPGTQTVNPGLGRRAWTRAGYRLAWLVYTPKGNHPKDLGPEPLVDARKLDAQEVRELWRRDYRYAILEQKR